MTETAVNAVELSAPAAEEEVSLQERLNNATEEEYKNWERTGDIPAVKPKIEKTEAPAPPKTETPAASKETETPTAAEVDATKPSAKTETAAAPVAAKPQKKRDGDARILQLLEERKQEREEWAKRLEELEKRIPKSAEPSAKSESSSAAEIKVDDPEPELGGVNKKTGKPYATVAEWQREHTAWLRAQMSAEFEGKLTKSEQQRQQAEQDRILNEGLAQRLEPGRTKYPDFEQVAFSPELFLPRGSTADLFIRSSDNAAEVLYYLGQHPEVLKGFYRDPSGKDGKTGVYENVIHPNLQAIELAKIETRLTSSTPVTPKPSAHPKPLPPPPTVLSARSSPAADAVEEAVSKKDFAAYERAANASERKARRA